MNHDKESVMRSLLAGKRVLITGVGCKPVDRIFTDITTGLSSHTAIFDGAHEYKANIGAATALECACAGAVVHIVARTKEKLAIIKKWVESEVSGATVEYSAIDLGDEREIRRLVEVLPTELPLYWVQSVGLGAGTVVLKDDNPYLPIDNLSDNLIEAELSVLRSTVRLLQLLLPRFRAQEETRVCIVSSMSAVRSVISGSMHNAAKGAISRFANAASLELNKDQIFVTDVRPGAVDTGMYDSTKVLETVRMIGTSYGHDYSQKGPYFAPPSSVGRVVVAALTSEAHLLSINMVARGQWPHEGS